MCLSFHMKQRRRKHRAGEEQEDKDTAHEIKWGRVGTGNHQPCLKVILRVNWEGCSSICSLKISSPGHAHVSRRQALFLSLSESDLRHKFRPIGRQAGQRWTCDKGMGGGDGSTDRNVLLRPCTRLSHRCSNVPVAARMNAVFYPLSRFHREQARTTVSTGRNRKQVFPGQALSDALTQALQAAVCSGDQHHPPTPQLRLPHSILAQKV